MWHSTPSCIPPEWRRKGADQLSKRLQQAHASDAPAYLWFEGEQRRTISFSEAASRKGSLSACIRAAAVATRRISTLSEDRTFTVGLVLRRTASLPLSQAACFAAGATFVPCDPSWPAARTVDILAEADASIVIIDGEAGDEQTALVEALLVQKQVGAVIKLDDECRVLDLMRSASFAEDEFSRACDAAIVQMRQSTWTWAPPEVMYIMYTSGSTGRPKGCIVPTCGVWHRFNWGTKLLGFSRADTFVLKTPLTFDCSIPEMWVPMYLGCTSVIVPDGAHLDFTIVKDTLTRGRVTVAHFVPSVLSLFLDFVSPGDLPDLRQISCTGEALLHSHRHKLTSKLGRPLPLYNLYGPTEASVEVSFFEASDGCQGVNHGFPIGYAGDGDVLLYVVDPTDPSRLLADGEKGELCIGGCQVAYGYLSRPDLSAERFLPNPHGVPGLMYRTGDLAIRDASTGWLEYNGRADRQVKVGGVRMELGEIEAVCQRLFPEQLLHVAVEKVGDRLVGVCAPPAGVPPPEPSVIQTALSAELPSSYVPAEWLFRDSLPLGSAGKVDHRKVMAWIADQEKAAVWGNIYDQLYFADGLQVSDGGTDPFMDWAAYTDSFTGKMHERSTIAEWVDETVKEIVALRPTSVIEMGCGKGMILFKVAASTGVTSYVGCDLSRLAIGHVERVWAEHTLTKEYGCSLSTRVRDASNFGGFADQGVDAVVCNGVSMYFPSAAYLVEMLTNALPKIRPGGTLHFGDVISLEHIELFLLRKARHAGASFEQLQATETRAELLAQSKDRLFSADLWYALFARGLLPGVAAVEVQLKHGAVMSEFSRYRYNVLLHMKGSDDAQPNSTSELARGKGILSTPTDALEARDSAEGVAASLAALATHSPNDVLACHSIPNARLTADRLLRDGVADAHAPAAQLGVGDGGGVDPAALRAVLATTLPCHHVVLMWARDGQVDGMDVYAIPLREGAERSDLLAGLNVVMASALEFRSMAELAARCDKIESFTNTLATVDTNEPSNDSASSEAVASEARSLWETGGRAERKAAVLKLIASKLGLHDLRESMAFAEMGANSFVAMQAVGAMREVLGVSAPVLSLLTMSLGEFAQSVCDATDGGGGKSPATGWLDIREDGLRSRALTAGLTSEQPSFVFFPPAGSAPKYFAGAYKELRRLCPTARCLFVQPPGRDIRSAEPNVKNVKEWIDAAVAALKPHLVGSNITAGPCVFVGDSWGAIAAFAVAHALRAETGFTPSHMVVSGSSSPAVASSQNGLGSFSDARMDELGDDVLLAFLRESGGNQSDASTEATLSELLPAFRADCELFEQYKRPSTLPPLHTRALVMRGALDAVTTRREMLGWLEEFSADEAAVLDVAGATHRVYEEAAARVAERLVALVGSTTDGIVVSVPSSRRGPLKLGPPCAFVADVDPGALRAFREGNIRYRLGGHFGSKGELSQLQIVKAPRRVAPTA